MRIRFDRGTLVLEAEGADENPAQLPEATWDAEVRAWRVPADRYREVIVRCTDTGVRVSDEIGQARIANDWQLPPLRWYQQHALTRWEAADRRGVIVLPTGAGKTLVALAAIARLGLSALVLVPTRVLLEQWARALAAVWPHPVGRLGDGDHSVLPITVATYASAIVAAPRIGDRFGVVVVDEAHHVGAWCPVEVLEMLPAAARLGLTATPPDTPELAEHVGPVVYSVAIEELSGDALAPFDLHTVAIALTSEERLRYRALRSRFASTFAEHARATGDPGWNAFVRAAARSQEGRAALDAWRSYRGLIAYSEGKRAAVRAILARHAGERTLVFTADTATTYAIARDLLVVPITHEIGRAERAQVLTRFREGAISVLVSAQVLDEGLDVPDADIAIIVGGSASARRHVQRIGRVLRPRPGKRAVIYELETGETMETSYVERRRGGLARRPLLLGTASRRVDTGGKSEAPVVGGAP